MLRVSKITDYGIVILAHLAGRPDSDPHTARELADEAGLPLPVVSKTLKLLARTGLLASQRGAKGGYALARPAGEVTLAEIVTALEGPIGLMECTIETGACDREASCPVRAPWQTINRVVRDAFERVSLLELIPDAPHAAHAELEVIPLRVTSPGGEA